MRRLNIAWTAVAAASLAVASVVAGLFEGQITIALGFSALAAAALSFRER